MFSERAIGDCRNVWKGWDGYKLGEDRGNGLHTVLRMGIDCKGSVQTESDRGERSGRGNELG